MIQFLAVNGTHENRNTPGSSWSCPDSELSKFLALQGLSNITLSAKMPFDWSDNLNFLPTHHEDWAAGGRALFSYLVPMMHPEYAWPPAKTVIVTHSHGLQVALYAAAYGLKIDRLLDIAGPVREDMMDIAKLARPNVRSWAHVHSDCSDRWQWFGEFLDGHLGIVREHPLADRNVAIPSVGHGGLMRDPEAFHFWLDTHLVDFLKTGA
jgi:hypothetical protein